MALGDKLYKLKEELRKTNPLIDMPEIDNLLLPAASMTHMDDHAFWRNKDNREFVSDCLQYTGCARIRGPGLKSSETLFGSGSKADYTLICAWDAYSPDFLMSLNRQTAKDEKDRSIYNIARKFDMLNKAELIVDVNNYATRYLLTDKNGEKNVHETCSILTPFKKECLPECSLKKICGKDYKVHVATPKEVSEKVLIPKIDKSVGPLPKDKWSELKKIGEEIGSSDMEAFRRRASGKDRESNFYSA